jgi:hypothetical protein
LSINLDKNQLRTALEVPPYYKLAPSFTIYRKDTTVYAMDGDGNTPYSGSDASTVIQSAINALTNGGEIFIKRGQYDVSSMITVTNDNVKIRGEGDSTILRIPNGRVSASNPHVFYVTANNFEICHLTIDGNVANQTPMNHAYLIHLGYYDPSNLGKSSPTAPRYTNLKVHHCRLINAVHGQIRAYRVQYLWIHDNFCSGVQTDTNYYVCNICVGWVYDFWILNNFCNYAGNFRATKSNNIIVSHSQNYYSGCLRGRILGNVVEDCGDSPIEVTSSTAGSGLGAVVQQVEVAHNTVRNGAGIISLQAREINIHDNIIIGPGYGGGNRWGIRLGCSTGSDTTVAEYDVDVHDNVIIGSSDSAYGIRLQSGGGVVKRIKIHNNIIKDIVYGTGIGIEVDGGNVASPNHTSEIVIADNEITGCDQLFNLINLPAESVIHSGRVAHVPMMITGTTATWTDMPAELTEFNASPRYRTVYDLSKFFQARLMCYIPSGAAGAPDAKLRAQYSPDGGTTWYYLDDATGPEIAIGTSGRKQSPWVFLASEAQAEVLLRIVGLDGDGTTDPQFQQLVLQFR